MTGATHFSARSEYLLDGPMKGATRFSAMNEYPLTDALGSVYATTDAAGAVSHRYDYDVWGVRSDLGGSGPGVDFGYTGQRHDGNGLMGIGDRPYLPQTGRWLQPDRAGMVDGPSLYQYVRSSPAMRRDPTGFGGLEPLPSCGTDLAWPCPEYLDLSYQQDRLIQLALAIIDLVPGYEAAETDLRSLRSQGRIKAGLRTLTNEGADAYTPVSQAVIVVLNFDNPHYGLDATLIHEYWHFSASTLEVIFEGDSPNAPERTQPGYWAGLDYSIARDAAAALWISSGAPRFALTNPWPVDVAMIDWLLPQLGGAPTSCK